MERTHELPHLAATHKTTKPDGETPAIEVPEQHETQGGTLVSTTLRVHVHQLDSLMELVGELVLTRNHILEVASRQVDSDLVAASQRLNSITSEMQQRIAQLRMQPISTVWRKFPRLVRDLAVQCGKEVRLSMQGEEIELDKVILEVIQDPLTHLVRNAIDHGIESPDVRIANGKPEEGTVTLRAFHENGQVNIEISDDGGGIDVERVKEQALTNKLITTEMAARLSQRDSLQLIFLPGLSTAKNVTDVSGRGVGMDVVKSNIERIGGTLDVQTRNGAGTTTKIAIPLTLAIVPALLVTSGGESYAIPQASVVELVQLSHRAEKVQIEHVRGTSFYRLRSELLQFASLEDGVRPDVADSEHPRPERAVAGGVMVVLQGQNRRFGLLVDEVSDTQEIVVRSIGKHLKHIPVYAGATILGDGRVALILDVPGLARRVCTGSEIESLTQRIEQSESSEGIAESEPLLIFERHESERFALSISRISRLEQLPRSHIEKAGGRCLVQRDGEILPVFGLSNDLSTAQPRRGKSNATGTTDENIGLIVCQHRGRSLGLAVDKIVDIVDECLPDLGPSGTHGASAPRIIDGHATTVLDLDELLTRANLAVSQAPVLAEVGGAMTECRRFCSFIVDGLLLGADVRKIEQVIHGLEITKVPSAPWAVRGLVNLRGQVIEAIEIRRCLGIVDSALGQALFHLIFRTPDGPVSLLVDEVRSVIEISQDSPSVSPETLKGRMREVVSLVYQLSDRLLPVLDMDRLLSDVTAAENRGVPGDRA